MVVLGPILPPQKNYPNITQTLPKVITWRYYAFLGSNEMFQRILLALSSWNTFGTRPACFFCMMNLVNLLRRWISHCSIFVPQTNVVFWNVAIAVVFLQFPMMGICCNHRLVKVVLDELPSPVRVVVSPIGSLPTIKMLNNTSIFCPSKVWSDRFQHRTRMFQILYHARVSANGWWVAGSAEIVIIICFWYHLAVPFETHMPICLRNPPEMHNLS